MTLKEVAARLRVSTSTVRRLVAQGRFAAPLRVGSSLRWRQSDLDAFLKVRA